VYSTEGKYPAETFTHTLPDCAVLRCTHLLQLVFIRVLAFCLCLEQAKFDFLHILQLDDAAQCCKTQIYTQSDEQAALGIQPGSPSLAPIEFFSQFFDLRLQLLYLLFSHLNLL
jgi:hypothetical protein